MAHARVAHIGHLGHISMREVTRIEVFDRLDFSFVEIHGRDKQVGSAAVEVKYRCLALHGSIEWRLGPFGLEEFPENLLGRLDQSYVLEVHKLRRAIASDQVSCEADLARLKRIEGVHAIHYLARCPKAIHECSQGISCPNSTSQQRDKYL